MKIDTKTDMTIHYLANALTWRDAVCFVIDYKTSNNEPFSSGEITKEIRENRPDLCFSHWDVGQYIRDLYYQGSIQYLENDYENPDYAYEDPVAVQIPRRTMGRFRTPEGVEVFVYGPNYEAAEQHDFEVQIPKPTQDLTCPYDEYGTLDGEGSKRDFKDSAIMATVHADGRLCIPRSAFDSFMHISGQSINLGDKVYVKLDRNNMRVFVSLDKRSGAKAYDLTRDRGRIKFLPDGGFDWNNQDRFPVQITKTGIEIDVSKSL